MYADLDLKVSIKGLCEECNVNKQMEGDEKGKIRQDSRLTKAQPNLVSTQTVLWDRGEKGAKNIMVHVHENSREMKRHSSYRDGV